MTAELLTVAALACVAICAAYWIAYSRGIQRGRDEQWADERIAENRAKEARERARRRNRWGNFAEKRQHRDEPLRSGDLLGGYSILGAILVLAVSACVALMGFIVFAIADEAAGTWQAPELAVVVDRSHENARTSTSTGTAIGANGQVHLVTTTSSESEKWTVIIRVSGEIVSAKATPALWAASEKGRAVRVQWLRGRWSGSNHGWRIVSA